MHWKHRLKDLHQQSNGEILPINRVSSSIVLLPDRHETAERLQPLSIGTISGGRSENLLSTVRIWIS